VMAELAAHLPTYNKGLKNIYDLLAPKIAVAIKHATRLQRDNMRTLSSNPSTRVHELVEYLIALKADE
jgi:hypothetical protein